MDDIVNQPNGETPKGSYVKITFSNFSVDQTAFGNTGTEGQSRAATSLKDACTRVSLAIFDSDTQEKLKTISQTSSEKDFGKITINIAKGKYDVVVIGHNGEGNCTITSPTKTTFKDNKVTDTFYYYGELDANENGSYSITMKRAVAMFRLIVKDTTPQTIHNMKFYYTGGSSTFDATTGYGCVNSKQTEMRTVASTAYTGESSYDIYTFPHSDGRALKIEVSALTSATATSADYIRTFEDVDITRNFVTRYTGDFFGNESGAGRDIQLSTDDQWNYDDYEY